MKQHLAALLRAAADRLDPPRPPGVHITFTGDVTEAMRHLERRYGNRTHARAAGR